jgi:hypothetical protein
MSCYLISRSEAILMKRHHLYHWKHDYFLFYNPDRAQGEKVPQIEFCPGMWSVLMNLMELHGIPGKRSVVLTVSEEEPETRHIHLRRTAKKEINGKEVGYYQNTTTEVQPYFVCNEVYGSFPEDLYLVMEQ